MAWLKLKDKVYFVSTKESVFEAASDHAGRTVCGTLPYPDRMFPKIMTITNTIEGAHYALDFIDVGEYEAALKRELEHLKTAMITSP